MVFFGRLDHNKNNKGTDEAFTQELFCNTLRQLEITGRVGFFGVADVNAILIMTSALAAGVPNLEGAVSGVSDLFERAYATKDAEEIAELKEVARRTSQDVRDAWDSIAWHRAS